MKIESASITVTELQGLIAQHFLTKFGCEVETVGVTSYDKVILSIQCWEDGLVETQPVRHRVRGN